VALAYNQRTCYCGQVGTEHIGQSVLLTGWVHGRRDLGGMVFIDLRDREGLVQLKFDPEADPQAHETAGNVRTESSTASSATYCVVIRGDVAPRPDDLPFKRSVKENLIRFFWQHTYDVACRTGWACCPCFRR